MEEREQTGEIVRPEAYGYRDPEQEEPRNGRSRFAGIGLILGCVGFGLVFIPYLMLPLGVMAILFGILALRRGEPGRGRAVAGIVLGSCLVLLGGVLIICMSALRPYRDDLMRIFNEYMSSHGGRLGY